ncbi:ATP-binding cassette-type vacuolar membrane transporter-like protein Hmt1 [Zopfia rhizophila CBS 207.26]|uniref:ATP-binding cassette-type vacuolar membrane transporter-like protein Hmt1 n=1 Tax=Zopfia rhizophila CBS 207.26 TaxID=1314779 RepID=A0A6A6EMV9_9PEZI|nr:ATP-binding cassette-type vacuolar membrane transporter-like protein Hmt1 [Zopfia rhizophila CBS 207.26]
MATYDGWPRSTALSLLNYMHAPAIGFCYLCARTFGLCSLQELAPLDFKRQRRSISLIFIIILSYGAQAIYHFSKSAPQHAIIHDFLVTMVWGNLNIALFNVTSPLWHPFFGALIIEFLFDVALCIVDGILLSPRGWLGSIHLCLNSLRVVVSFGLVVDGFILFSHIRVENHTNEECQSLLEDRANGPIAARNNDINKDIEERQKKNLNEASSWFGYMEGFAMLLPYLWPKDDWKITCCLVIRGANVIQKRFLNILIPRQIGIITDILASGSRKAPWKDISLWMFYQWLGSYAGFGAIDTLASDFVRTYADGRIKELAFSHVMSLSADFHSNKNSGEVIKAVEQAGSLSNLIQFLLFHIIPMLIDMVVAVWYAADLFDIYMAFIILAMGEVYIWQGFFFTPWTQSKRRENAEDTRTASTIVYESISSWSAVFYFNRTKLERERYNSAVQTSVKSLYDYMSRCTIGVAIRDITMISGFISCSIFAILQIVSGKKTVGNLLTFLMYWGTITGPIRTITTSVQSISSMFIDSERLFRLLKEKPSVADPKFPQNLTTSSGTVEFKDVNFSYDIRKPVLKSIGFVAEPGKTIAFVGETGGGKSTIMKLLFRFYDVTGGSIMIDGQDIRSVAISSLREVLGVVPQDPVLFNQSILENIRYARLDASQEEIKEACKAATIHDQIMSLPEGYYTEIGERGVKLSGGELQRVAIARVLLKNPKIVILDEATSSVDSSTDAKIQEAFKCLTSGRTKFVVAHRLSTIVEADTIMVVDHGEIIERGTHNELLEKGGKYAELWIKQAPRHPKEGILARAVGSPLLKLRGGGRKDGT